jgi:hypothetical protein
MEMTKKIASEHFGATAGAIVGGYFYILGGSQEAYEPASTFQRVSLIDAASELLAPMPTPRGNVTAIALEHLIFAVAGLLPFQNEQTKGSNPCTVVELFDTQTGEWRACSPLPRQRVKPGLAAANGKLYAISGREDESDASTIFAYEPKNDSWSLVRDELPFAARHGAACALDGVIYYCGGHSCHAGGGKFQDAAISFNPVTNEIETLAPMPSTRAAHAVVAHGGAVYALGGVDSAKKATSTVFRYDIAQDRWHECRPLSSERAIFACDTNEETIYLAGGWKQMRRECNTSAEHYIP